MEFIPRYFADKLLIINPRGSIGVVTLWSKPDYIRDLFGQAGWDLDPATSPVAAFGTLYGNGLRELLRNLLYNPQIQTVVVCGRDRSGSYGDLKQFFEAGLEPDHSPLVAYRAAESGTEVQTCRIRGTKRLIDNLVRPEMFARPPSIRPVGGPEDKDILKRLADVWENRRLYVSSPSAEGLDGRQDIPLPEVITSHFPSNPRGHTIIAAKPLAAWRELLYIISRFGHLVTLAKGERLELQNVKVVVEEPALEAAEELKKFHFDKGQLDLYRADFVGGKDLKPDETYNYAHRMRAYFQVDSLRECARRLQADPEDRKAYLTLWDNARDLLEPKGQPCFVSAFFRRFEGKLTLTATFRTHNALDAWLPNLYGLMAVQEYVAEQVRMARGAITIMSHSISIDRRELDRALSYLAMRPFEVVMDPCGYFRVSLDGEEIFVEHRFGDVTLKEYRGRNAVNLQHQIARDRALSDINHALYLGRQLARAEFCLKEGVEFIQE